jgi:hypothetical protein
MSKLKPIGSEKLQGDDKLKRILEIAKYKETPKQNINETSSTEYKVKLADGHTYEIAKEKMGYVIKKQINESVSDYVEPMKNRRHYTSYSAAFKRLNLIAKEVNTLTETVEGISLFSEQKKYTLRTPKPEVSAEGPAPMEEPMDAPMPEPTPSPAEPEMPAMDDEMSPEEPMDLPEPSDDMEDNEDVTFKTIQKLTGKLAQKIRDLQDNEEDISSKDAKYVINSILSAISDNLDEDDKEDIIGKLEGEDEDTEDMGDMGDDMDSEEVPTGDEEMPSDTEELPIDAEMTENWNEGEVKEEDFLSGVFNNIFKESQVDRILKGYFVINENEKKFITQKKEDNKTQLKNKVQNSVTEINRLSESKEQRKVAKDIMLKFPKINFVGKTNKGNLVFENNNKQLKVGRNGQIL